jgi:hypothetical protein
VDFPDWTDMEFYHWLLLGAAVAVLALLVYFLAKKPAIRVPAAVVGVIASLVAGVGLGAIGMAALGYKPIMEPKRENAGGSRRAMGPGGGRGGRPGGMGGGMGGRPGGMGGGMGGPPGGMGGMMGRMMGPPPKAQLASLVTKLDQLTSGKLTLQLTDDEKKAVAEQTKGLLGKKEISDKDAQKRLDALLEVLGKHRGTLEAAGFRFPGAGGGRRGPNRPNPFTDETNGEHLKALRERVGAGKAGA